jgi:hypothetical protein
MSIIEAARRVEFERNRVASIVARFDRVDRNDPGLIRRAHASDL